MVSILKTIVAIRFVFVCSLLISLKTIVKIYVNRNKINRMFYVLLYIVPPPQIIYTSIFNCKIEHNLIKSKQKQKSQQHPKGFPGGPPPQY